MSKLPYDKTKAKSIERYAKALIGRTFRDVLDSSPFVGASVVEKSVEYGNEKRKGGLGNLLEEQDVFCGYAVIEMFSSWCGHDVTEESLYREYGRVVTSTGKSFSVEMNKRFPEYETEINRYLT